MKHPRKLLPAHIQKHDRSCIAWGIELIMKMHNVIKPTEYPLQDGRTPCAYGFTHKEIAFLKKFSINAQEQHLSWNDFTKFSYKEVSRGSYPIISLPLHRYVELSPVGIFTDYHAFVICDYRKQIVAYTMLREPHTLHRVDRLEKLFQACAILEPECEVHVLSHSEV